TLTEFMSRPPTVSNWGPIKPGPDVVLSRRPGKTCRRLSTLFPTFGRLLIRVSFRTSPTDAELEEIAFSLSADTSTTVCCELSFNWKFRRTGAAGDNSMPVYDSVSKLGSAALTLY